MRTVCKRVSAGVRAHMPMLVYMHVFADRSADRRRAPANKPPLEPLRDIGELKTGIGGLLVKLAFWPLNIAP